MKWLAAEADVLGGIASTVVADKWQNNEKRESILPQNLRELGGILAGSDRGPPVALDGLTRHLRAL